MSERIEIQGTCDPRFKRVRDQLQASFDRGEELGASVCVTLEGRTVVDLFGGHADAERTRPWQADTLVNVFSTTKGITAICALRLVDEGRLDLDAPVARYWPEFAAERKQEIPVRWLLSHRAGLPAVRQPLPPDALYRWEVMTEALAQERPWWEPGTRHGYHAITYGYLVGEVVRRVAGKSVGTYFRDEIARPLGIDFHIGTGPEHDERISPLVQGPVAEGPSMLDLMQQDPEGMLAKAFANPPILPDASRSREWRAAEIPAANGHGTARALARLYGGLACGGTVDGARILRPAVIEQARTEQSLGQDALLPLVSRFGLGFGMPTAEEPVGPNPRVFGHAGAGGSYGQADPEARMGFGYTMNLMHMGLWLVDPRPRALLACVYDAL
jgi:CubicO group peptidase (beta-lactamase class C family)